MCGILGRISLSEKVSAISMREALDLMIHRGPDASGEWMSPESFIWLGHRRLSIIDLSALGEQPMVSFDKSLVIVFNGEIYNYISIKNELKSKGYNFKSESDTEVLLNAWHCWGNKTLKKIDGMFAFAIVDLNKKCLFIARDRIGEKPLYYKKNNQGIVFASELKSILHTERSVSRVNHLALNSLLGFGYVPGELCIIEGVMKLPPASLLTWKFNDKDPIIQTYWIPPQPATTFESEQELLERLDRTMSDAVKSQMMADVPVGVMLSGGLDSSLITAYASEQNRDVYTFTVGFEGYGGADERHFARQVAQWFGTRHRELNILGADPDLMTTLAAQCCEPNTDPAIIPGYMIYKAASKYCKVVMGGDGGDEIFGGYDRYEQWLKLKNKYQNIPNSLRSFISNVSETMLPIGFKGRHSLMQIETDFNTSLPLKDNLFSTEDRRKLLNTSWTIQDTTFLKKSMVDSDLEFMERSLRYDIKGFLPDNILTKVDRSSMLSSVEVRSPFLSRNMIEFALHDVHPALKRRKKILRQLASKKLPVFINTQRKQGFVPPLEHWMKEKKWKEFIKGHLFSSESIFNKKMLDNLMGDDSKQFFNKRRIFALIMIQLWMNCNKIKV